MSNIYDIFNSRKGNPNVVVCEGFELENVVLENYEDPSVALYEIVAESDQEFMELQAAMYMGDLVLESMMYENFDEEEIASVMEGAIKERIQSMIEALKRQWAKLVAWFKQTIENIKNFFTKGEELVKKNKAEIPKKMKASKVTAKVNEYFPVNTAIGRCEKMISNVKGAGQGNVENVEDAKSAILKQAGANDMQGVAKTVRAAFIQTEKPVEKKIAELDPNIVMDYVANKKSILDGINKAKSNIDKEFQEILNGLKQIESRSEGDAGELASKKVKVFQFALNVKNRIINAEIACVKKGASDNKMIIIKALGGKVEEEKKEVEKRKITPEEKKRLQNLKNIKMSKQSSGSTGMYASFFFDEEDIDFIEEDAE